jgi:hypothetical protein
MQGRKYNIQHLLWYCPKFYVAQTKAMEAAANRLSELFSFLGTSECAVQWRRDDGTTFDLSILWSHQMTRSMRPTEAIVMLWSGMWSSHLGEESPVISKYLREEIIGIVSASLHFNYTPAIAFPSSSRFGNSRVPVSNAFNPYVSQKDGNMIPYEVSTAVAWELRGLDAWFLCIPGP